jgi:hypothetical protein
MVETNRKDPNFKVLMMNGRRRGWLIRWDLPQIGD